MSVYPRFMVLALSILLAAMAHADPATGSIVFVNKTTHTYTLTLNAANCVDDASTQPVIVTKYGPETYQVKLRPGCDTASIEWGYTQRFDSSQLVTGKVTYEQFKHDGKWMARLDMDPTPPLVTPNPILTRTACGSNLLACAGQAVEITNDGITAHYTVIRVFPTNNFLTSFQSRKIARDIFQTDVLQPHNTHDHRLR